MLPGMTSMLAGGAPPTYGVDRFTKSLMKFDGGWSAALGGNSLTDYVKKSRVWASTNPGNLSAGQRFCGTAAALNGATNSYIYAPINDPDYYINPGQDFTIDFWMACAAPATAGIPILVKCSNANPYGAFLFYQGGSNAINFYSSSDAASWNIASALPCGTNAGAWAHYAVQRRGNVWNTWCNGVKQTEWTSALNPYNPGYVIIGNWISDFANAPWTGYIDELRFSSCARYTANFTPQLFPYYGSLDGGNDAATKILLHFNENIVDSAAGPALWAPHPTSLAGTISYPVGSPLGAATDTVAYFSGAQNTQVAIPWSYNADTMPGASDWTLDFWYYRIAAGTGMLVADRLSNSTYATWLLYDVSGNLTMYASFDGSTWGWSALNLGALATGVWQHIAVGNCGNAFRAYINGVKTYERAAGAFTAIGYGFSVGSPSDSAGIQCYIDEVRFSDVARWTANFTPPTVPYGMTVASQQIKLLMHFDSATGLTDSSVYNRGTAALTGTVNVTGAQQKFGDSSALFNGTNGFLQYPDSVDWTFPGDFTIDYWIYLKALPPAGTANTTVSRYNNDQNNYWLTYIDEVGTVYLIQRVAGTDYYATQTGLIANKWSHIAHVRAGGVTTTYINGIGGGAVSTPSVTTAGPLQIGVWASGNFFLNGYIDELRISKGIAQWTSNFVPPGSAYTKNGFYLPGQPIIPPGPATHFVVTAPASALANAAFNITVQAQDANNAPTNQYSGTIHFTSSDGAAVLPANSLLTNGVGTFSVTLKTGGNQTVTLTDTITSTITGTSSAVAIPLPATHFSVTAPTTTQVNTTFNVTVQALDVNNANTTNYAGTVRFTSTDGAAVLPAPATLTNGAGTFGVQLKTGGTFTVTATDTVTSSITGTTSNIVASTGPATPQTIFLASGTTWTVPNDWTTNNSIECIGGGGNGSAGATNYSGSGGGGGGYSKVSNVTLTPGGTCNIGIGGVSGTTFFKNTSGSTICQAAGGGGGGSAVGGAGGAAASGIGTVKYSGGAGGGCSGGDGGGGGGAGGPLGNGGAGGTALNTGSGGGGGNGGGGVGQDGNGTAYGGNNAQGYGGGAGALANGSAGSAGGGGGGYTAYAPGVGGAGGNGIDLDASHGSGGGGGGSAADYSGGNGGSGGLYGGGGGGAWTTPGAGRQGIICIKYQ